MISQAIAIQKTITPSVNIKVPAWEMTTVSQIGVTLGSSVECFNDPLLQNIGDGFIIA